MHNDLDKQINEYKTNYNELDTKYKLLYEQLIKVTNNEKMIKEEYKKFHILELHFE